MVTRHCSAEPYSGTFSWRGNDIGATTYGSIKSILQNGLDKAYANSKAPDGPPIRHANIRGRGYYH